jgi:hypothetical protein
MMAKLKMIIMGASAASPKKKNGNTKIPPPVEFVISITPTPSMTNPTTRRRISLIFTSVRLCLFAYLNNSIPNGVIEQAHKTYQRQMKYLQSTSIVAIT